MKRRTLLATWKALPRPAARGLTFALATAVTIVLLFTPASRFAERYIFSANYLVATAGIVVALQAWPALGRAVGDLDRRVPAAAAVLWVSLMILRLTVGPFLPRISG